MTVREHADEIRRKYLEKRNSGRPGLTADYGEVTEEEKDRDEFSDVSMTLENFVLSPDQSLRNVNHLASSSAN